MSDFNATYPEYAATVRLDILRATEYSYLDEGGHVYLDYTGAGLSAQSQLLAHTARLRAGCYGNPHSDNPTSSASTRLVEQAREAVLRFFNTTAAEYAVIFTDPGVDSRGGRSTMGKDRPRRRSAMLEGATTVKYMILLYGPDLPEPGTPEAAKMLAEWTSARQAMTDAGVLIDCAPLQPPAASTTVRVRDGETLLTDGPAAEIKEVFGGFTLIECDGLDEALAWAARLPTARDGKVEVRPLLQVASPATGTGTGS